MANRKTKHTLDNILPEKKDSYDSFYKAINSPASYRPVDSSANADKDDRGDKKRCNCDDPKR